MRDFGDVLIVEDSAMQAKRLKRLLEAHGHSVIVAGNGADGLEKIRQTRPRLVVSDIVMPVMDGYRMCRFIKNDESLKHIPVILLTSLSNPEDVFRGLESGADCYISKPYDNDTLLARIESITKSPGAARECSDKEGVEVFLGGKKYVITSSREQILNLLLSTYQDAVEQNRILREMRTKLVMVNEKLEKLVAARTQALNNEIVERKRIEEALASEKERLSVTLRSIEDGVITTNTEGTIILMNRAAEELTGWPLDEAVGKTLTTVFQLLKAKTGQSGETVVENILKSGGIFGLGDQVTLVSKNRSEHIVAVSGTPIFDQTNKIIGVVIVFRDITESKRIEEELIRAQKLESLGVLAGGIAHDFNNLLTAILGNVSLAKMYAKPGDKMIPKLEEAEKASFRAKDLTMQLLTFSKGGAPVKKIASIASILRNSVEFALRGTSICGRFSIPEELWPVEVDEGQISQAIHNLVINSKQAMSDGGVVKISAEDLIVGPEQETGMALPSGQYVCLTISDEGTGIPAAVLPRIFDPYFTTKKKAGGLGLATSYSILKNHGGMITVNSEVGVGTTFRLFLPASAKNDSGSMKKRDNPMGGTGSVLVMDDEDILRNFLGEFLSMLGYTVNFAHNGEQTIQIYCEAKRAGRPFDCVLMDLTIPGGMGGKEAIGKLLEIDPEVKAIVSSGYSDDPVMADFAKYGFCGVVAKPYDTAQLSAVIHSVIGRVPGCAD